MARMFSCPLFNRLRILAISYSRMFTCPFLFLPQDFASTLISSTILILFVKRLHFYCTMSCILLLLILDLMHVPVWTMHWL